MSNFMEIENNLYAYYIIIKHPGKNVCYMSINNITKKIIIK